MTTVKTYGFPELQRKLKNLASLKGAKAGLRAGAVHVRGKLATYPPATIANSPGRQYAYNDHGVVRYREQWYERNYGTRYRRKRKGGLGGKRTSESLGKKWTMKTEDDGLTQAIGNNASYARKVHDPKEQASFHARRGWKTTEQVIEQERKVVVDFIRKKMVEDLKR